MCKDCLSVVASSLLCLVAILGAGRTYAAPPCKPNSSVTGEILKEWVRLGADPTAIGVTGLLGCPLSEERDHPEGEGRVQDFANGQIVWTKKTSLGGTPRAFLQSAFVTAEGIQVEWGNTDPYHYDFFQVRWQRDGQEIKDEENCPASCQYEERGGPRRSGRTVLRLSRLWHPGQYRIIVQGCEEASGFRGTRCRQGWSLPLYVDYNQIDFSGIPAAQSVQAAKSGFVDRANIPVDYLCRRSRELEDFTNNGLGFTAVAYAKLDRIQLFAGPVRDLCPRNPSDPEELTRYDRGGLLSNYDLVNQALLAAKVEREVGTNYSAGAGEILGGAALGAVVGAAIGAGMGGGIGAVVGGIIGLFTGGAIGADCARKGDYDMTLQGLIPIVYRHGDRLWEGTRQHIVHDLLVERGGADKVRKKVSFCAGLISVEETENHILMTESSRYLTNQLLAAEYRLSSHPVPEEYDNQANGMNEFILRYLQEVLLDDFHEYNSRPYQYLSVLAIHNLFEFAEDVKVKKAAQIVLDYLAGKFAISSNGLRRSVPFRRQPQNKHFTPLFGHNSDTELWRFIVLSGNVDLLQRRRYGRVDWGAGGLMLRAGRGRYRVPDMVLDMVIDKRSNTYFQRFRHEGVELYASSPEFLISAGGVFREGRGSEQGWALPTILMPTADGADRNELIQISGSTEPKIQANTCVAPGFACGLNPWVPDAVPQACIKRSGNWRFINFATQWNRTPGCDRPYGFYVAVYSTPCRTSVCRAAAGGPDSPQQFGLFEAAEASERYLFDQFISDVLTKNGDASKLWDSERGNPYETVKGTKLVFTPNRVGVTANDDDLMRWGIREIGNEKQETDMWKWPLAEGSIMNSETDGRGNRLACVMIDNPALQRRLILDLSDWENPRRGEVQLPSECKCGNMICDQPPPG